LLKCIISTISFLKKSKMVKMSGSWLGKNATLLESIGESCFTFTLRCITK
jgi:hypothetical protein